jgi:tetratricopeptide (TPR) repeat protein
VSLVRKEVIRPDEAMFPDDEAYRFRHLLIRDAAYDSLPKETRADLHERFADWLERHAALVEQDEIVGYHLESAHRNRAELDGADPRLEDLARRAAARLRAAANGAMARGDHAAVAGLLHRAVALLPEGDPERLEALIVLGDPLATGVRAERALEIAAELAASRDPRFQAFGAMVETWAEVWGNEWLEERAIPRVEAAAAVFREHGDELGLALVERHEWYRHWMALRLGPAALAAARGAAHAMSAGDDSIANDLIQRSRNYHYDMSPVDDTLLDTAQAHLDEANGTVARGVSRRRLAQVLAIRGAFDAARAHVYAGAAESREAGLLIEAAGAGKVIAAVELRAGDAERAETVLRDALEELERVRGLSFYPTTALQLAELLALRGAYDEAVHWCAIARDRMADDDVVDVIRANAVEGFLAAVRGDHIEAERLASYALEASAPIDGYAWKAGSHQWAARTFELIGKPREAREHAAKALEI